MQKGFFSVSGFKAERCILPRPPTPHNTVQLLLCHTEKYACDYFSQMSRVLQRAAELPHFSSTAFRLLAVRPLISLPGDFLFAVLQRHEDHFFLFII